MIGLMLAGAIHTSPSVLQTSGNAPPARYVRMRMDVYGYGIRGAATLLVDRQQARYAEHFDLGPQSFSQGFDGVRAWQADVESTAAVEGNQLDGDLVRAWGDLFAYPGHASNGGSRATDSAGRVVRFTIWNGLFDEVATFGDYHAFANGVIAPRSIRFTDDNGTWTAHVTSIEALTEVSAAPFAPPSRRHDSSVEGGQTSVPFLVATEIVIPVQIDGGPVMHFILDTGGQNLLTTDAVKRLGLQTVGHGSVGGAGAGVIPTTFLTARSVRIGNAEMRDQPFLVIDSSVLQGIDGIVGYELLSRFAARIDYRTNTLTLAASLPPSWVAGVPATPFLFRSRAPQITGSIDAFPGQLTLDTGNSGILDVNAPFAEQHRLWTYYHAAKPKTGDLVGVGGAVAFSPITVRRLRLGSTSLNTVYGTLAQAKNGIEADASFAANVGEGVFRDFTLVLDYAHQNVYFAPGGIHDMSGIVFVRRGHRIVVSDVRTRRARSAGIRAGMTLTSLNGRSVGSDLAAVSAALSDQPPGTQAHMIFDGTKTVTLQLINYL